GEKGYATVRLSVREVGGHSSMPGRQTAVGRLARAVARVQDRPMPLRVPPVTADMLARLRAVMPPARRALLRFAGAAAPLAARVMAGRPQTEALVRTTTAPTVIRGGVKANVLPQHAEAMINFRILPGDSVDGVLEHCRRVIGDPGVSVELVGMASEPSRAAAPGPAFELVARLAREVVPGVAATSGLVPGATDSRHYDGLARTRCNFAPVVLTEADLATIHGTDERISRLNYARLIEFDRRLIQELAAGPIGEEPRCAGRRKTRSRAGAAGSSGAPGLPMGRRARWSCSCTASPSTRAATPTWARRWRAPGTRCTRWTTSGTAAPAGTGPTSTPSTARPTMSSSCARSPSSSTPARRSSC